MTASTTLKLPDDLEQRVIPASSATGHPLISRPVEEGPRALRVARGRSELVTLYRLDPAADIVLAASVRLQREAGFDRS